MNNAPLLVDERQPATGPLCAAVLSAAIGCGAMGLLTLLAELIKPFSAALGIYKPSGALSGEATFAVILWLLSWVLLARLWKHASPRLAVVLPISYLLLAAGLLMTFPPFLHLLHH